MPMMCWCREPNSRRGENVCLDCGGMISWTPPIIYRLVRIKNVDRRANRGHDRRPQEEPKP